MYARPHSFLVLIDPFHFRPRLTQSLSTDIISYRRSAFHKKIRLEEKPTISSSLEAIIHLLIIYRHGTLCLWLYLIRYIRLGISQAPNQPPIR